MARVGDCGQPDYTPSPFKTLYLFYHIGEPASILVRRFYTDKDAIDFLWGRLRLEKGPFGAWRVVSLNEEGIKVKEVAYSISSSCLSDPITMNSLYME